MTVDIPEGASTSEIARILKKSGVITEPFAFRLYVMLKQEDGFQSGEYIMTDKMDYDSIIYALQAGTERTDVVEIMFPERIYFGRHRQKIGGAGRLFRQ